MLRIGFGKSDFTPRLPVPLAGYAHLTQRVGRWVRDPLFVRAIAFEQGETRALLLVYDLLMITEDLVQRLQHRLQEDKVFIMVHATHTHSSLGGYVPGILGRFFAGKYDSSVVERLAQAGERAARLALDDLREGSVQAIAIPLPGLNGNRRDPAGPVDEELSVVRLARERDVGLLISYSAHPVIVAERDHHAVSADFPGEVVKALEKEVAFAAFVQGSLGGVDVLFPKNSTMTIDKNLALMAEPIANSAINLARLASKSEHQAFLKVVSEELTLPSPQPSPFFDDQPLTFLISRPIALMLGLLVPKQIRKATVLGIRVGPCAIIGFPADLGVRLGIATKAYARRLGIEVPVAASQCNGYIGYLHLPEDYRKAPPKQYLQMAAYENVMSFFGHKMGEKVFCAAQNVIERLKA